ncbi:MAG: S41 family peptidase [Chloroflexota bacterium]
MTDHTPGAPPAPPDPVLPSSRPEPGIGTPVRVVERAGPSATAWIVSLVLAAVVGAMLFSAGFLVRGGGSAGGGTCTAPSEAFVALCEAYAKLKAEYVDELDDGKLVDGAIQGMFQYGGPDPFSGYMPPEQYQQALGDLSGKFEGIGAEMALKNVADPGNLEACPTLSDSCVLVVVAPIAGSPAEAAGLQAGDIVTAVDGTSVDGSTMQDQITKVRGAAGTDVTLSLNRDGRAFDLTITRAEITTREVTTRMIDGHIGYIGLHSFSDSASDQFHTALTALLDDGADQIIFDLRDNPGGYIEAARRIGSEFIKSGLIFSQESAGNDVKRWEATGSGAATDTDIPVVVLTNEGSASASEIVAAALKETGRATVIGQPTFGKNTVQVWAPLDNEGGVRITISRWFTPQHNSVAPDGLAPDITVEVPPETPPEQDLYVDRAVEYLSSQGIGEPGASSSPAALGPASRMAAYDASGLHRIEV